jgi:ABC-2 type transport system permease protein
VSRVWTIIKREYLENVRTKAFLIGVFLTPVWIGIMFAIPALRSKPKSQVVVIVDETATLGVALQTQLESSAKAGGIKFEVRNEQAEGAFDEDSTGGLSRVEALKRLAGSGKFIAVVLTKPLLEKRAPEEGEHAPAIYTASTAGGRSLGRLVQNIVNGVVTEHVLQDRKISKEIAELIAKPAIRVEAVDESGEKAGIGQAILPLMAMVLLYIGIMGISQMLISSTLEEKANRVYEVLLSSVSPFQLMAGKILGVCGVGLTLLTIWSSGGLLAASAQGGATFVTGAQIGWFLTYYLLGFFMIASLMVAIGSACNTIKEAQNLMAPMSMLLVLPMIVAMMTLEDPNGTLATAASFVPPFTPFLMMARMAGVPGPPDWQVWGTLALLVIATYAAVRLAARVFRVGILLYGQPPSLKQIWRWMRVPD